MNKRVITYSAVGVCSYIIFMLLLFPVNIAWNILKDIYPEQLSDFHLTGLYGGVLNAQVDGIAYKGEQLGRMNWRIDSLPLLRGASLVSFSLQSPSWNINGRVTASLFNDEIKVAQIEGQFPIQELGRITSFTPIRIEGDVDVNISDLVVNKIGVLKAAYGFMLLNQASVIIDDAHVPIGNIRMIFNTDDKGQIYVIVNDEGGYLSIDTIVRLHVDGRYEINGEISVLDGASEELKQTIGRLAQPGDFGRYQFVYSGRVKTRK